MFKRLIRSPQARRRTSWVIAGVLILPFIFFFHAASTSPPHGPGGTAGILFGQQIPWQRFEAEWRWLRRQWQARLGQVPQTLEAALTSSAWDRLMLLEEAQRLGLSASDEELAVAIRELPQFQQDGRFRPDRYQQILRAIGMSPQAFEASLRNDLLMERLLRTVREAIMVSEEDAQAAWQREHEEVRASLILVEATSFLEQAEATVTEEAVRAYYDTHPEAARVPEQLVIEYLGVSREELAASLAPEEADLVAWHEARAEQFAGEDGTVPPFEAVREQVRRQVADRRVRERLVDLAFDLETDLERGLRFEELALAHGLMSRVVGPVAADGSSLPDALDPAVFQAVVSLPERQLSGLVETDRGVYVARVIRRIPQHLLPVEAVRERLRSQVAQDEARRLAQDAAAALRARLLDHQADGLRFEEALLVEGLTAMPVEVSRAQPMAALGEAPRVAEAAFSAPLGRLTEVLEAPDGFVLLRPEAHIPADLARFAEVAERFRQELLRRRQSEHVEAWLTALRRRAELRRFVEAAPPD
jgi:peptidyl-prolyl cis-trans isomerase D